MYTFYCPNRVSYVQIRIADLYSYLKVWKNKIDFIYRFVIAKFKKKVSLHVNNTDIPEQFCYNLFCHHTYGNFHYILRTLPWLLIPHYNTKTVTVFHVSKILCVYTWFIPRCDIFNAYLVIKNNFHKSWLTTRNKSFLTMQFRKMVIYDI